MLTGAKHSQQFVQVKPLFRIGWLSDVADDVVHLGQIMNSVHSDMIVRQVNVWGIKSPATLLISS
jgi:hypothetical protein